MFTESSDDSHDSENLNPSQRKLDITFKASRKWMLRSNMGIF